MLSFRLSVYTFSSKFVNADGRIRTSGPVTAGLLLSGEPHSTTLPHLLIARPYLIPVWRARNLSVNSPDAPGWIRANNVHHLGHGFTDRLLQPFAYRRLWREAGEASVLLCQYYSIWTWANLHYF